MRPRAVIILASVASIVFGAALVRNETAASAVFQAIPHGDHVHLAAQEREQPPEEGKPLSCDNHKQTAEAHRCHCARDEQHCNGGIPPKPADVEMDRRCLTFCREQRCRCVGHGCAS